MEEHANKIIELLKERNLKVADATGLIIDAVPLNSAIYIIKSMLVYPDLKQADKEQANAKGCYICNDTSNDRYHRNQGYIFCPHCRTTLN